MILVSLFIFIACVKLLSVTRDPMLSAGVFAVTKLAFALFLGAGLSALLIGPLITGVLAFGYFWLLDRVEGSGAWFLVLVCGVVLMA